MLREGPTLVVSPLLALQRDQIESLDRTRAPEAVAVNSAPTAGDRREAWEAIREGDAAASELGSCCVTGRRT